MAGSAAGTGREQDWESPGSLQCAWGRAEENSDVFVCAVINCGERMSISIRCV